MSLVELKKIMKTITGNKKVLAIVLVLLTFLPIYIAYAQDLSLLDFATSPIDSTLLFFLQIVGNVLASSVDILTKALNLEVYAQGRNILVSEGWEIIRDFTNMLFIIGLIVMAFATIFDVFGGSAYSWQSVLARFVVAALLINFSLVIGGLVIDSVQVLNNVFLRAIGDAGARLGGALVQVDGTLTLQSGTLTGSLAGSLPTASIENRQTIQMFFTIIMLSIAAFSVAVAMIFSLIRIPFLWFLLIVSPIAWLSMVLPTTRGIHRNWWKNFMGWNFFMPIFLFFLYFGLYFLSRQADVMASLSQTDISTLSGIGFITLQGLFFYIFVAIFLIGGTNIAYKSAFTAGAFGVSWAAGTSRYIVKRTPIPYLLPGGLAAREEAYKRKFEQLKKEGLPTRFGRKIYGGAEGFERDVSRLEGRGLYRVRGAKEKQLAKDVDTYKERLKQQRLKLNQLEARMNTGAIYEQLAARELVKEARGLNADEIKETFKMYGGLGAMNAQKFITSIDPKNLSKSERDDLYKAIGDINFKQKINKVRAENGEFDDINQFIERSQTFQSRGDRIDYIKKAKDYIKNLSKEERKEIFDKIDREMQKELGLLMAEEGDLSKDEVLRESIKVYDTNTEKLNLLNKARGKNLVAALRLQYDLGLLKDSEGQLINIGDEDGYNKSFSFFVSKLSNEGILELSTDALKDKKFQDALRGTLSAKRVEAIINNPKYTAQKGAILDEVLQEVRKEKFIKDMIVPYDNMLGQFSSILSKLKTEVTIGNRAAAESLEKDAQNRLGRAEKMLDEMEKREIDDSIKDAQRVKIRNAQKELDIESVKIKSI